MRSFKFSNNNERNSSKISHTKVTNKSDRQKWQTKMKSISLLFFWQFVSNSSTSSFFSIFCFRWDLSCRSMILWTRSIMFFISFYSSLFWLRFCEIFINPVLIISKDSFISFKKKLHSFFVDRHCIFLNQEIVEKQIQSMTVTITFYEIVSRLVSILHWRFQNRQYLFDVCTSSFRIDYNVYFEHHALRI